MMMIHSAQRSEGGFGYVELLIAMSALIVAMLAHAGLTVSTHAQNSLNQERRLALEGLRGQLDRMRTVEFKHAFATFDTVTTNDPPGAVGPNFAIAGLNPSPSDGDGFVGRVIFPVAPPASDPSAPPVLREDVVNAEMGMPADLDGDGVVDDQPKDEGYLYLPVIVEARWRSIVGEQRMHIMGWLVPPGEDL